VLSVLLRFTYSDYPFGIFKLFLLYKKGGFSWGNQIGSILLSHCIWNVAWKEGWPLVGVVLFSFPNIWAFNNWRRRIQQESLGFCLLPQFQWKIWLLFFLFDFEFWCFNATFSNISAIQWSGKSHAMRKLRICNWNGALNWPSDAPSGALFSCRKS